MKNNENCCIAKILKVIDVLQKNSNNDCLNEGCDKPFLGSNNFLNYNTRPITLYTRSGNLFSVEYYVDNVLNTSSTFRVEGVKGCCAKLRILVPNENDGYNSTDEFVTVNLECFCVVRCLNDTFVEF